MTFQSDFGANYFTMAILLNVATLGGRYQSHPHLVDGETEIFFQMFAAGSQLLLKLTCSLLFQISQEPG